MSNTFEPASVASALGIDDAEIALRKVFLGFTDVDAALLAQAEQGLCRHRQEFVDAFYAHLEQFPEMRALIPDGAVRERLKRSQEDYFRRLSSGDYGAAYVHDRLRVGLAHQHVGLTPVWYMGAYCHYLRNLLPLLCHCFGEDRETFLPMVAAWLKIVFFDMGLAIDTYIHADKQAIFQLESQVRCLVDGIDAIVWEATADLESYRFVSHQTSAMLGYRPETWISEPSFWSQIIVEKDRDAVVRRRLAAIAEGRDHEVDYRVLAADGRLVWIHERVNLVRDHNGVVTSLRGFLLDVSDRKRAEEEKQRFLAIVEATTDLVAVADTQGRLHFINGAGRDLLGISSSCAIPALPMSVLFPEQLARDILNDALPEALRTGSWTGESCLRRADGSTVPVSVFLIAHRAANGDIEYLSTVIRDVGQAKRTESQLRVLKRAIESSPFAVSISDLGLPDNPLIYVNPAFERITGYVSEEVVGKNCRLLQNADADQPEIDEIRRALRERRGGYAVLKNYRKDGSMFWNELFISPVHDESGAVTHFIGIQNDITQRRHAEERLTYLATHDELTGLPNRTLLQDRMRQAMARVLREGGIMALLFIDLDRFKNINDSLGHEIGDAVLRTAAGRLLGCIREGDTVARLGGDEFVVMLTGVPRIEDVTTTGQKLLTVLASPFHAEGHHLFVTASAGISLFPRDGDDVQSLLKNADTAMYRAKEKGKNRLQFYAEEMNAWVNKRLFIETQLRHALDREEFVLHYQPQVDLETGRISGAEALVRWNNPQVGLIAPSEFIPIAEETGLIVRLGAWVLENACRQAAAWQQAGHTKLRIAVNLSARQLTRSGLVELIDRVLAATGMDPRLLELELTESMLIEPDEESTSTISRLSRMGVRFSLDDFGTGYSALGYLNRFPLGAIKLDRSFIADVTKDRKASALARSIISMAHELRMRVVAEGVETEKQLLFLAGRECDEVQGFFLGRPVPAEQFAAVLQQSGGMLWSGTMAAGNCTASVLFVDEKPAALAEFQLLMGGEGYRIRVAESADRALDLLTVEEAAVIVAGPASADMPGWQFLAKVKEMYPRSMRILLADDTATPAAEPAIGQDGACRILWKPWDWERLRLCLIDAFQRYRLDQESQQLAGEIERANHELVAVNAALQQSVDQLMDSLQATIDDRHMPREQLDRLPVGIVGLDDDGRVVYANRRADSLIQGGTGQGWLADCVRELRIRPKGEHRCILRLAGGPLRVRWTPCPGNHSPFTQVLLVTPELVTAPSRAAGLESAPHGTSLAVAAGALEATAAAHRCQPHPG